MIVISIFVTSNRLSVTDAVVVAYFCDTIRYQHAFERYLRTDCFDFESHMVDSIFLHEMRCQYIRVGRRRVRALCKRSQESLSHENTVSLYVLNYDRQGCKQKSLMKISTSIKK